MSLWRHNYNLETPCSMKKTHIPLGYYMLDAGRKGERGRLLGVKTLFPNVSLSTELISETLLCK